MFGSRSKRATLGIVILVVIGILAFVFFNRDTKQAEVPEPAPIDVTQKPSLVKKVIGTSIEGRKIESYTYGTGKNHIVFVGGIHGGYEWNSVLLAYQFLDYVDKNPNAIPASLTVTVIPSANPDAVFKVVGKEGRFTQANVSKDKNLLASARFNAHNVDLNRNFDCNWQPKSTWQSKTVSAGTAAFSEPEALAIKNFAMEKTPSAFVFWHSQANAVYASECNKGILPATLDIMNAYAKAAGYQAIKSFDSYKITGDAEGWLASINIPAITVELKTHETVEWEKNLAGIKALFRYYEAR
jgi:predicted deacylase